MKCIKGYEVEPHRSGAGYFMGTVDEFGAPNCRISQYAKTAKDAMSLPLDRQNCSENNFCNGCGSCFKR